MLKQGSFINKKFDSFVMGNIWGTLAYCINLMTDSLVSGNQLGEVSLQAVSIVYPLFSIVYVFSYFIPPGASVIFGKKIGAFNEKEAYRTAGTSIVSSIIIGVFLSVLLWFIRIPFLTYFECTGELLKEALAYYNWLILYALLRPLVNSLVYLLVADGEALLLSVAGIADVCANVSLSIVLSRHIGIAGLGIATCIGLTLTAILYIPHFLKKSNNVKFILCLDLKIVRKSIVLSLSDYMYCLFIAIVDIVMNKIIIIECGIEFIPAYSVINLVFGVCMLFESLNMASLGFVTCFIGEKNNHGLHLVFRKIKHSMVYIAAGITVFFFFFAPMMPIVYGMKNPVTIDAAIFTSRIMAFTAFGFGAQYLTSAVSISVEKPLQSLLVSFLNDGLSPLLLALPMASLWGFKGITIGMCLSPYLAFGVYAAIRIPKKGKANFPIYVEDYGEEGISYDLYVTTETIPEIRDAVCKDLVQHGYQIKNIDILMEEFFTRVMEKNPGKTVIAECTLLFGEKTVRIIIRDDGVLFNFIDENNRIESLNAHILNSLLEQTEKKNYLITTSFNRNGFIFEK